MNPVALPHMLQAGSASLHIQPQLGQGLSAMVTRSLEQMRVAAGTGGRAGRS